MTKYIPSALTLSNLCCGFLVLLFPEHAILLILLGALFDVFDGAIARWLNATSNFGQELDSLSDLITFGVAPAFLLFTQLGSSLGIVCVLIPVTAAIRLAKFNLDGGNQYYFLGLATPASALFFLGYFNLLEYTRYEQFVLLAPVCIVLIAMLNVTNLKMFSFKGLKKDRLTPIFLGICCLIGVVTLIVDWKYTILITMISYIVLSIVYHFMLPKFSEKTID